MKLYEVANIICTGQIISRVEAKEEVGDVVLEVRKVLVPSAITDGCVNYNDLSEVKLKKHVAEDRITQSGDIVLKLSTPYDAAYIDEDDAGLIVPSFCVVIRGIDSRKTDPQFIMAYVNTGHVRNVLKSKVAAISRPVITLHDIKELNIPPITIEKQKMIAKAYEISCQKRRLLKEMLINEQVVMESIIISAARENI